MSSEQVAVTVVVLTWNRRLLLAETVESVLRQTFRDLEVLVVDNESDDGTQEWATAHPDPRVRYVRHANGGNISVNRNFALGIAKGRYVAFCDDDDLWEPSKLERQIGALRERPEFGVCSANALQFTEEGDLGPYVRGRQTGEMPFTDLLTGWHDVQLSTVVLRRSVLDEVGPFNEDPGLFTVEDYEYWLRAAKRFRFWYIDEELVRYRVHSGMASHRDTREVLDKQAYLFSRLLADGVITEAEHATAIRNLGRNRRVARVKELLKRSSTLRRGWYAVRRLLRTVRGGGRG